MSHKPDDAKDHEPGEEAGRTIANTNHDAVPVDVVAEFIVAGESYHSAPSYAKWEEDLNTGVSPNLKQYFLLNLVCVGCVSRSSLATV